MKVNCPLEFTDADRARIRASVGRGGLATRKEIRIFVDRAVRTATAGAPEPKTRRRASAPAVEPEARRRPLEQLQALPDETRCVICCRPKSDHGRMGLTCPPRPGCVKGLRFSPGVGQ